jgi:predicted membrane protein
MTWGLWFGKSWARTITMILAVIGIVTGIFSLPGSLVSILIDIVILYYLRLPEIKAYFASASAS